MKKRALSLLMSLVLLIGLLPATARAAETSQITVQMTVYDQGQPAKDKENKAMLLRSVTVEDLNADGKYTLDEALRAAHGAYYEGGTAGYGADETYGYVTKLWGTETSATGFYKNDVMTDGVKEEVLKEGDRLTAFIYYDQTGYSDRYAYFDVQKKTVQVGQEFELTLKGIGYDQFWQMETKPVATAPIGVFDLTTGGYSVPNMLKGEHLFGERYMTAATGSDGKVKCSFTQTGTYYVTAQHDSSNYVTYLDNGTPVSNYLVPPVCVVTVLSAEDYAAYQNKLVLDGAKGKLTWASMSAEEQDAVTAAPALPSALTVDGKTVSVSWASTNAALSVADYGYGWSAYVDRPAAQDADVTLTATLTYIPDGGTPLTDTVVFSVTVKAEGVSDDKTSVVEFKTLMDGIAGTYTTSSDAWTILDMAAYGQNIKGNDYGYSSAAATLLAQCALGEDPSIPDSLKTFDVTGSYAIYTTPYVLLGYDAAQAQEDESFTNTRTGMKTALVAYLNDLENNYAGVDEVAPILAALAPYYGKGNTDLDAAVDAGITWLSRQQNSDGTFSYWGTSNANSSAMAVVALSALGIDAHQDTRFIKNSRSAVEGLLSFALATDDGFGYKGNVTKNTLATEQGFRALVSYARFAEKHSAYNIYLEAKAGQNAPADPGITATQKPSKPSNSEDKKTVAVTVTVKGVDGTWLKEKVSVNSGSSVYDAIVQALEDNGYTLEGSRNYISGITAPDGTGLEEKEYGENSGWLYKVNGKLAQVSVGEYILEKDSSVTLYYTLDWTQDPDAGAMAGEAETPETPPAQPDAAFGDLSEDGWYITGIRYVLNKGLMTGTGTNTFAPDEPTSRAQLVTILWRLAGSPKADRAADYTDTDPAAWYAQALEWAAQAGLVSGYEDGRFAPDDTVTREQFAAILLRFVQMLDQNTADDQTDLDYADAQTVSPWARQAMAWCVANGILSGTGADTLSPGMGTTRAQMAVMLMQLCKTIGE